MAHARAVIVSNIAAYGWKLRWIDDLEKMHCDKKLLTGKTKKENGKNRYEIKRNDFGVSSFHKLFCRCGFEGEVKESDQFEIRHDGKEAILFPFFYCPVCEGKPDFAFGVSESKSVPYFEFVDVFDNRPENPKITLSIGITYYYFNKYHHKLGVKATKVKFTHNTQTGFTYLITPYNKVKISNISYGNIMQGRGSKRSAVSQMLIDLRLMNEEQIQTAKHFLERCMKARGIQYKQVEELLQLEPGDFDGHSMLHVFPYLRFPQLQNLPTFDWMGMPEGLRKKMKTSGQSAIEVFRALTGHSGKSLRKKMKTNDDMKKIIFWSQVIQNEDLIRQVLDHYRIKEQMRSLFDSLVCHEEHLEVLQFIATLHQSEKQFVKCLFKLTNKNIGRDLGNLLHYLSDIEEMHRKIVLRVPDYSLPYRNDLKRYHDELSRDYGRLEHERVVIPYETEELDRYEKKVGEYQFVLAKTNHELVKVGTDLRICVGSYDERAIKKQATIVFMKEGGKVTGCIELVPFKKEMRLLQAKKQRNEYPTYEEAVAIKKWCRASKILLDRCSDLREGLKNSFSEELIQG